MKGWSTMKSVFQLLRPSSRPRPIRLLTTGSEPPMGIRNVQLAEGWASIGPAVITPIVSTAKAWARRTGVEAIMKCRRLMAES